MHTVAGIFTLGCIWYTLIKLTLWLADPLCRLSTFYRNEQGVWKECLSAKYSEWAKEIPVDELPYYQALIDPRIAVIDETGEDDTPRGGGAVNVGSPLKIFVNGPTAPWVLLHETAHWQAGLNAGHGIRFIWHYTRLARKHTNRRTTFALFVVLVPCMTRVCNLKGYRCKEKVSLATYVG